MKSIRWVDMIDPVYTLAGLMDINEGADIMSIHIGRDRLSITYIEGNAMKWQEASYELD